LCAAHAV